MLTKVNLLERESFKQRNTMENDHNVYFTLSLTLKITPNIR